MKNILLFFIYIILLFISAVAHENDLSRNYNETGDAKAWFFQIKK